MKIKVSPIDKKLLFKVWRFISVIFMILTTILTFFDIKNKVKQFLFIVAMVLSIIVYFVLWIMANQMLEKNITINGNEITLKKSDIFEDKYQNDIKIIPCNNYFDTRIGHLIHRNSINGH